MLIAHLDVEKSQKNFFNNHLKSQDQLILESQDIEEVFQRAEEVEILSLFIHTKVNKETLDKLPNLRLIITRSTGFNHIDIEEARNRNILVCNIPEYGSNTVAEHTFALLLAVAKKISNLDSRTKMADFNFQDCLGFDLHGKTIGIIGAGKIGKNVIQIARGFDMNIISHDIYQDHMLAEVLKYKYVDLDTIFSDSDIISIHTPVNEYTKNIFTRENLNKIKKGTVLINTSRGELIENEDLLYALDNNIFSVAGLDAIKGESEMFVNGPNEFQKRLISDSRVLYTPHSAFYTQEALDRILLKTIEIIENYLNQKEIKEVVN